MDSVDFSPLIVAKYSHDVVIDLVRYKTGWEQRSQVTEKAQLRYLFQYLDYISTKTVVIESEYVDRHYLEDYSEYYARCFSQYPRKCCRIHFFNADFTRAALLAALTKPDRKFHKNLAKAYLGHAVIRPIPHTFLGRVCLKPYDRLSKTGHKIIKRFHNASLFGLDLSLKTVAFLEQDKVVSACATSALWTLLNAALSGDASTLPSPSTITKSANAAPSEGTRTFPTSGLKTQQVARSLKAFALEPTIVELTKSPESLELLKEHVYAYITNDIPLLLGGKVFRVVPNDAPSIYLGRHFICALGYHRKVTDKIKRPGSHYQLRLSARMIDKIYVHDDRYGPFARLDTTLGEFKAIDSVCEPQNGEVSQDCTPKEFSGLPLYMHGELKDYFVPDVIIFGLYHKVRISYEQTMATCDALHSYLAYGAATYKTAVDELNEQEKKHFSTISKAMQAVLNGDWDIHLIENAALKRTVVGDKRIVSFNGLHAAPHGKTELLLASMPKYIWRCRIFDSAAPKSITPFTDLLLDATEIPQGSVMIGYIAYSQLAESLWKHIEKSIGERMWEKYDAEDSARESIGTIVKFFTAMNNNNKRTSLNTLYGPLSPPTRLLKPGETDNLRNIKRRVDITTVRRGISNFPSNLLDKNKRYIWVIDDFGDLVFGEDIVQGEEYEGHPTLVDGKPARLGGELFAINDTWYINSKSRAYSSHLPDSPDKGTTYLSNIIEFNFPPSFRPTIAGTGAN